MPTNDFLQFCQTDTGTNLLSESDYLAAAGRTSGQVPGIASSQLNNKALRQANYITSQFAQFLANLSGTNLVDDATPAKLLAQINACIYPIAPHVTQLITASGTFNLTYVFMIASGSATIGATYTNNAITFTVIATVASGIMIRMSGSGAPTLSGTLTKASGTGDSSLTFYAVRAPIYLLTETIGGGGGGAGGDNGNGGGTGVTGSTSSFGTSLITCPGGPGGAGIQGAGASTAPTVNSPAFALVATSGAGASSVVRAVGNTFIVGGAGGAVSPFLGAGAGGVAAVGGSALDNSGSGGGGAGTGSNLGAAGGGGGATGAYVKAMIFTPTGSYPWVTGAGGAGGVGASGNPNGGPGGSGRTNVIEYYQ